MLQNKLIDQVVLEARFPVDTSHTLPLFIIYFRPHLVFVDPETLPSYHSFLVHCHPKKHSSAWEGEAREGL